MGTRGYKVYRHKGRYFCWYNHRDSYPSNYGLKVLREIPNRNATPEEFQQWLTSIREILDDMYDSVAAGSTEDKDILTVGEVEISKIQPKNDIMIEWVYEIDLDNLVFHVDTLPIFRLDHLPPPKWFLKGIGFNHYRHRSFNGRTPKKYRYNWTAPPPSPDDSLFTAYRECVSGGPSLIQDLLFLPETLSKVERCRLSVLELLVSRYMLNNYAYHFIRKLENIPSRNLIPEKGLQILYSFLALALNPMIFPNWAVVPPGFKELSSFVWLQSDVCLRITTHLDDEANLQAAVGEIVREVKKKVEEEKEAEKMTVFYGVAFSAFHCVIVKIETKSGFKCTHTSALQFLPSWYAFSPSTPGITALARLGVRLDSELKAFSRCFKLVYGATNDSAMIESPNVFSTIPQDVCDNIAQFIYSPTDIVTFGLLSPTCNAAANQILRFPHIFVTRRSSNGRSKEDVFYRLLSSSALSPDQYPVVGKIQEEESQGEDGEDEDEDDASSDDDNQARYPLPSLLMADFSAITGEGNVVLKVWHYTIPTHLWLSPNTLKSHARIVSWEANPLGRQELRFVEF